MSKIIVPENNNNIKQRVFSELPGSGCCEDRGVRSGHSRRQGDSSAGQGTVEEQQDCEACSPTLGHSPQPVNHQKVDTYRIPLAFPFPLSQALCLLINETTMSLTTLSNYKYVNPIIISSAQRAIGNKIRNVLLLILDIFEILLYAFYLVLWFPPSFLPRPFCLPTFSRNLSLLVPYNHFRCHWHPTLLLLITYLFCQSPPSSYCPHTSFQFFPNCILPVEEFKQICITVIRFSSSHTSHGSSSFDLPAALTPTERW